MTFSNRKHSAAKTTSSPAASGSTSIGATNPDVWTNFIPSFSSQVMGQWFPTGVTTATAQVTSVWYEVTFTHTAPSYLDFRMGYDDTGVGGTHHSDFLAWTGLSSDGTFSNTTHAFDGLDPYAYYYISATNTSSFGAGEIDSVNFEVYWIDYPNLKVYTGTGSANSYNLYTGNILDVSTSFSDDADVDADPTFYVAWYAAPAPTAGCSALTTFDTVNDYLLGTNAVVGGMNANTWQTGGLSVDLHFTV